MVLRLMHIAVLRVMPFQRDDEALAEDADALGSLWLRTNGVRTNEAAAKVTNFDRLGKKVRPGTFGKMKVG